VKKLGVKTRNEEFICVPSQEAKGPKAVRREPSKSGFQGPKLQLGVLMACFTSNSKQTTFFNHKTTFRSPGFDLFVASLIASSIIRLSSSVEHICHFLRSFLNCSTILLWWHIGHLFLLS
jgi:hypothetical protein